MLWGLKLETDCTRIAVMEQVQDRELIMAVQMQEPRAFDRLIQSYLPLVRQISGRFRVPTSDRDDIEQEIFLRVYRHLDRFNGHSRLSTWIARIAINVCLNSRQRRRPELISHDQDDLPIWEQLADDGPSPGDIFADKERSGHLSEEIDQLPTIYGLVLVLYHFNDMSYREIGDLLQMPDGTVKSYLFRARAMLRDRLTRRLTAEELSA